MREMVRRLIANGEPYSAATLALTGRDLIAAGVAPDPDRADALRRARRGRSSGVVPNETAALLSWLDL